MRTKFTALAAACTLAVLMLPAPAQADHAWEYFHWARASNPFTVELGDNVDGRWDAALYGASADWSASGALDTAVVPGFTRPRRCRPTLGRVEVCNAYYGYTGWLGVASIAVSDDGMHIAAGTVQLNDSYFDFPPFNTPEWRNSLACQEIGHVLGLDHQDESLRNPNLGTCMDYTLYPSTNQRPNVHDYEQLEAIYAHGDSTTTVGTFGWYGQRSSADSSEWGQRINGSWGAGRSTYWRDLGRGGGVITFVTWA